MNSKSIHGIHECSKKKSRWISMHLFIATFTPCSSRHLETSQSQGLTDSASLGITLVTTELGIDTLQRDLALALGLLDTIAVSLFVLVVVGMILALGHCFFEMRRFFDFFLESKHKRFDWSNLNSPKCFLNGLDLCWLVLGWVCY